MYKYLLLMSAAMGLSGRFASSESTELSSDDMCHLDVTQDTILPVGPSPLTYAYLSEASYIDAEQESGSWVLKKTEDNEYVISKLEESNWVLADFVARNESGYVGSIWVNEDEKQVVLAHRGSANVQSWATDLRSVARTQSSDFVNHAIEMLNNPTFLKQRAEGFHLSITGHSLGGFLAQTCVAHSYRRGGAFDATYYPGIAAVVFDSPGAADFIDYHIRSGLESEKSRLSKNFNIMNFCVSPTVVSTFGRYYGVIYQFAGKPREWASVVMDHKLGGRIRPYLEEAEEEGSHWTSSCYRVAQWPESNLPKDLIGAASAGMEAVTKGAFWVVNSIWKKAKSVVTGDTSLTIAESALGSSGNPVWNYFEASTDDKDNQKYEKLIKISMKESHRLYPDEYTRFRMGTEHLERQVLNFMESIETANKVIAGKGSDLGWKEHLQATYGEGFDISSLRLESSGERKELVLDESTSQFKNVFFAVESLQRSLIKHGTTNFNSYLFQVLQNTALLAEADRAKIKSAQQSYLVYESAVAEAVGSIAKAVIFDTADTRKHRLDVIKEAGDRSITLNSAVAKAPNSTSIFVKMDQSGDVGEFQRELAREVMANAPGEPGGGVEKEEVETDSFSGNEPGKK